jgi:two-component system, cell cycle sensor histidine kinase and response regulator CckA
MSADEEMYHRIVKAVPEGIWVVSPQGRTIFCNERMAEILGTDVESLQRLSCFDPVFPSDLEEAQRQFGLQMAGGCQPFDFRLRRIDGSEVWVSISCRPMYDDGGVCSGLLGLFTDISERRRAESRLRDGEELFRAAFFQAAVGMAQNSPEGEWLLLNDRLCEILGYAQAELRGKAFLDVVHPDDREASMVARRQLLAGEISSWSGEKRYIHKSGATVWVRAYLSLVRDQQRLPLYFISVIEDITDRIRAERSRQDSEQRLQLALRTGVGLWEHDLRSGAPGLAPQYSRVFGHSPLNPAEWFQLVHPDDRERVMALVRESIDRLSDWDAEFRLLCPDGSVRWLLSKGTLLLGDDGHPARVAGVSLDITERKRTEAALRESEERFRNMADAAPVMICASGANKLATFFNRGWLEFTGRTIEQELGYGWTEAVHPDDLEQCLASYSASFEARRDCHIEYRLRRADGEYRSIVCNGAPRFAPEGVFAGYIASCFDITDVKRAQDEALARQKLESLGVLAGGIAHDFNNLLGGILAQAELIEADLPAGSSFIGELHKIKEGTIRGAEIVRQLMIYAGQDQSSPFEPLDLSRLVQEMLGLLKVSISKQAVLKANLGENLPAVWGNAPQIRQVVMNLLINASEAIGEKEGVIQVGTSRITGGQGSGVKNGVNLASGECVQLEVSDTGCGVTEEAKAKIFDPFFTTKFAGRGLGLAAVQGIIRNHGGTINLESTPGQGSCFEILLPCIDQAVRETRGITVTPSTREAGSVAGTVLVVEDEEMLRLAVSKILRKEGFSVVEAGDGTTGANLFRENEPKIDVVLLDVTLPGMSCREVLEELRRIHPGVKVILTSAFSQGKVLSLIGEQHPWGYIRKPYQLSELTSVLRKALDEPKMSGTAAG